MKKGRHPGAHHRTGAAGPEEINHHLSILLKNCGIDPTH
jgi:hypothetical protein